MQMLSDLSRPLPLPVTTAFPVLYVVCLSLLRHKMRISQHVGSIRSLLSEGRQAGAASCTALCSLIPVAWAAAHPQQSALLPWLTATAGL